MEALLSNPSFLAAAFGAAGVIAYIWESLDSLGAERDQSKLILILIARIDAASSSHWGGGNPMYAIQESERVAAEIAEKRLEDKAAFWWHVGRAGFSTLMLSASVVCSIVAVLIGS